MGCSFVICSYFQIGLYNLSYWGLVLEIISLPKTQHNTHTHTHTHTDATPVRLIPLHWYCLSISLEIYEINPSCLVDQYLAGCLPVDCAVTTVVSTY